MRLFHFAFLGLLLTSSAFAYSTPPGFDSAKWTDLVTQIMNKGFDTPSYAGLWKSLSRVVPSDLTKSHQADYISTLGQVDQSGKYIPSTIYDVSENWQLQDGVWHIDQWIYTVAMTGELEQVEHFQMVEDLNGHIQQDDSLPTGDPTDPAQLAHWGQVLSAWY